MPTTAKNMVKLEFYTSNDEPKLESYDLTLQQREFTSSPLEAIKLCEEDHSRFPIVILYKDKLAGFFVLHGWEGVQVYSKNEEAILIRAYSISNEYQGKGIAQTSLQLLAPFVKKHFPEKKEIILAVNHQNTIAQHVYKKCGFVDKGIRVMGRKGEQFVYHKDISED